MAGDGGALWRLAGREGDRKSVCGDGLSVFSKSCAHSGEMGWNEPCVCVCEETADNGHRPHVSITAAGATHLHRAVDRFLEEGVDKVRVHSLVGGRAERLEAGAAEG